MKNTNIYMVIVVIIYVISCQKIQTVKNIPAVNDTINATTAASIKIEQYIPYHDTLKKLKNYLFPAHHEIIGLLVQRIEPAVASISVQEIEMNVIKFSHIGSGVVISADGVILTLADVVEGADHLKATLFEQGHRQQFDCILLISDPSANMALIKIKSESSINLPYVMLGKKDDVFAGDWIIAAGSSDGMSSKVLPGIVTISSMKQKKNGHILQDVIQTDLKINDGFIGCPVFDIQGGIIGLNVGEGAVLPIEQAAMVLQTTYVNIQ